MKILSKIWQIFKIARQGSIVFSLLAYTCGCDFSDGFGSTNIEASSTGRLNGDGDDKPIISDIKPDVKPKVLVNRIKVAAKEDAVSRILIGDILGTSLSKDQLRLESKSNPTNGQLSIDSIRKSIEYNPDADYFGPDVAVVEVFQAQDLVASVTLDIIVASINDRPVAKDQSLNLTEDSSLTGQLLATDIDSATADFEFHLVLPVSRGLVTVNIDGSFEYSPEQNFVGTESFVYYVSDGKNKSLAKTVTLSVSNINDRPIATSTIFSLDVSNGVYSKDFNLLGSDIDGPDSMTYEIISTPTHGEIKDFNANTGEFKYFKFNDGYNGTDEITYKVFDGVAYSTVQTVTINLSGDQPPIPPGFWTHVTGGRGINCGINKGRLYCWGLDLFGILGDGPNLTDGQLTPYQILVPSNSVIISDQWESVTSTSYSTCGINSGRAYCWGLNLYGNIEIDSNYDFAANGFSFAIVTESSPISPIKDATKLATANRWTSIFVADHFSCGIENGNFYCWGQKQLDKDGLVNDIDTLFDLSDFDSANSSTGNWVSGTSGAHHYCGIDSLGQLFCAGEENYNQLGSGDRPVSEPILAPNELDTKWSTVVAGRHHTCAIDSKGQMYCWGGNDAGELGNGHISEPIDSVPTPHLIMSDLAGSKSTTWQAVYARDFTSCGINSAEQLYCWGHNHGGVITGTSNSEENIGTPTLIPSPVADVPWTQIGVGVGTLCGIIANGHLYCWGDNSAGQIGNGLTTANDDPKLLVLTPYEIVVP